MSFVEFVLGFVVEKVKDRCFLPLFEQHRLSSKHKLEANLSHASPTYPFVQLQHAIFERRMRKRRPNKVDQNSKIDLSLFFVHLFSKYFDKNP